MTQLLLVLPLRTLIVASDVSIELGGKLSSDALLRAEIKV